MNRRLFLVILALIVMASMMFAVPAFGIWQEKLIHADNQWHAVSGTYSNTPEEIDFAQISGACHYVAAAVFRVSNNAMVYEAGVAPNIWWWGCPLAHVIYWQQNANGLPNYSGGVYIAMAGSNPTDSAVIGGDVNGVQLP